MRLVMRSALALSLAITLPAMADGISIGIGGDDIDPLWGSSGYVTLNNQSITAQAVDRKGRLLVAGHSSTGSKVTRLLANGQPDTTFGSGGARTVSTLSAGTLERPTNIIPLADGSMLLVINRFLNMTSPPISLLNRVIHISASGSVNATFGRDGGAQFDGLVPHAFRDSRGRLYLLTTNGMSDEGTGKRQWWLRRLLSNGMPDTAFGEDGILFLPDAISLVMAQRVGEIVQVRYSDADSGCDSRVLDIIDDEVVSASCSGDSGLPFNLFSAPYLGSSDPETMIAWTTTDTSTPPEAAAVNFGSQAHALGFVYSFGADRIDLVNPVTAPDNMTWTFSSEAHAARINNGMLMFSRALADGSMVMSFNSTDCDDYMYGYCAPSTIFKTSGLSLDLTPDAPATAPAITFDGLHYVSEPLLIGGLTNYTSVPVRIVGGEISLDGETWLSGWVWVRNGLEVRIRYLSEATVTVGGIIAPTNPTLAVGEVVSLQFSGGSARIVKETTSTNTGDEDSKGGGSGGGSADWAWLALLGLALGGRRLRRTSAH